MIEYISAWSLVWTALARPDPLVFKHSDELNLTYCVSDIWASGALKRRRFQAFLAKNRGLGRNNENSMTETWTQYYRAAEFQHALHGVEAVRAGRDATSEAMANSMADAQRSQGSARTVARQIGSQRRAAC